MIFGSVCSGIEAASAAWGPLGWRCAFVSEIEAFPRAVLKHHYPEVPLHGDFTTIQAGDYEPIDLLVGGTPCQSFSVAGLRGGLGDDRGNLTLEFLRLADRLNPKWVVWENVPGVISDKTDALTNFLDGLEALGYVVDVDILDAQFFGVAQRRRRVFVCGQKAKNILEAKTLTSALTISQCLVECSLLSLAALSDLSTPGCESLGFDATEPVRSLQRRMTLFELGSSAEAASAWVPILAEHLGLFECAPNGSASAHGRANTKTSAATASLALMAPSASPNIAPSWNSILADALAAMNGCITSTATSATTESKIYSCALLTALIAERITQSMDSSPSFWSAASSTLTALRAFTDYARSASSYLFTDVEWVQPWADFGRQADALCHALGNLRARNFGQVFPVAESLSGDPAPRRKAGKGLTHDVAPSLTGSGRGVERAGETRGQDPVVVTHAIQAGATRENPDSGPDGVGVQEGIAYTLEARAEVQAVTHALRGELRTLEVAGALAAKPGMKQQTYVQTSAVRRLTPVECERLQGFPDNYTLIPWRKGMAPDGPRYKALGNSMAVPVMRWIGERIAAIEALAERIAA